MVRMPQEMERQLRAIADEKGQEAAELLRWAAEAIIRCYAEHGDIPRDMELRQRRWTNAGNQDSPDATATG